MRKVLPYVVTVLVILAGVIWSSDQVTLEGERTIYSVNCADGAWSGLRCTGRLVPGERYRFRASRTRNEVVFWVAGSPEPSGIHRECTVKDRGNWKCNPKAGDPLSVTNEMVNNAPKPIPGGATPPVHGVPKWQWWALRAGIPGFHSASY
jgi:hypothetical protein